MRFEGGAKVSSMRNLESVCIGLLTAAVGFPLLLLGLVWLRRSIRLWCNGVRIIGRVTEHYREPSSEGNLLLDVVFHDQSGVERQCRIHPGRGIVPQIDQEISLIYDPVKPENVSGATYDQLWNVPVICCVLGGVVLSMGIAIISGLASPN